MNLANRSGENAPAVALVTAARNEAAYIGEWLHHHLYMGFGPIEVHVNRSDDQTEDIVARVAERYAQVSVRNVDVLDHLGARRDDIQLATFKEARDRLKREMSAQDYLCFLDVDEFWTPVDLASSIQDVLRAAGMPKLAAFNWFNRINDVPEFGAALIDQVEGRHHLLTKSCFHLGMRPRSISVHGAIPLVPMGTWFASGERPGLRNFFTTKAHPTSLGPAFVLHRFYRSPIEYLALLGRMRPKVTGLAFKENRDGWNGIANPDHEDTFTPPPVALARYSASRDAFMTETGIAHMTVEARASVIARATDVTRRYLALSKAERFPWKAQFRGLDVRNMAVDLGVRRKPKRPKG